MRHEATKYGGKGISHLATVWNHLSNGGTGARMEPLCISSKANIIGISESVDPTAANVFGENLLRVTSFKLWL